MHLYQFFFKSYEISILESEIPKAMETVICD